MFGQKYELLVLKPIAHPSAQTLARYLGDYQMGPLTVKITLRDGKLYVLGTGQPVPYGLIATSDTEFYLLQRHSGVDLGLPPRLTQTVKTLVAVRRIFLDRQDHCSAS